MLLYNNWVFINMPKVYQSTTRKMVLSIRRFCELEKAKNGSVIPLKHVLRRVAVMTGVSEETVKDIIRERKAVGAASTSQNKTAQKKKLKKENNIATNVEGAVSTSQNKRTQKKKLKKVNEVALNVAGAACISQKKPTRNKNLKQENEVALNVFEVGAIRNIIYEMYTVRKKVILNAIRDDIQFQGGHKDLYKILKQIGFRFEKCGVLMENPDIVIWRRKYLNILRERRKENIPIIFLGETSIHASFSSEGWQIDHHERNTLNTSFCTWILVYAGGELGFVPNAFSFFKCQELVNHKNYMCSENFMDWLQKKLIPHLPPNTLIVMDNASYHSEKVNRAPSAKSTKAKMQNWLTSQEIPYEPTMLRAELYEIIKRNKEEPTYKADKLLEAHGHCVARLPPNHGEFNTIEYIWKLLKGKTAGSKVGHNVSNIATKIIETLNSITVQDWYDCCQKVCQIENKYFVSDGALDKVMDTFLKEFNENSDSESDCNSNSSLCVLDDECKPLTDVPDLLSVELYY